MKPSLGPVSLGDSPAQVLGKLGEPIATRSSGDHLDLQWSYDGLDVHFLGDAPQLVGQIETTNPGVCTASGVCPGSSLSQVVGRLGAPLGDSVSMDGINTWRVEGAEACWLDVVMGDSVVKSLAIRCQP